MSEPVWHPAFAKTGRPSLITTDPLDELVDGIGVEVEYFACENSHNHRYICLLATATTATVLRQEHAYRWEKRSLKSRPRWEGELECSAKFVQANMAALARLGLWDLDDFFTTEEVLDGEFYVVRAKDTLSGRDNALVLFCPDESDDVRYRKIAKRLHQLLTMERRGYLLRSWLSRILPL